jgi:hypothetical protein
MADLVLNLNNVRTFDPGLSLKGVVWAQLPDEPGGRLTFKGEYYEQVIKVQVPPGTQFIHGSLLSFQVAFGTFKKASPKMLGDLRHYIKVKYNAAGNLDIENGYCTITFTALLQDAATIDESSTWSGWFLLELTFFG